MPDWCPKCRAMIAEGLDTCPVCGAHLRKDFGCREILAISLVPLSLALIPIGLIILIAILCTLWGQ